MKKTIELTLEQARELLGKDYAMDVLIRANFTDDELKGRVARWEDLDGGGYTQRLIASYIG